MTGQTLARRLLNRIFTGIAADVPTTLLQAERGQI